MAEINFYGEAHHFNRLGSSELFAATEPNKIVNPNCHVAVSPVTDPAIECMPCGPETLFPHSYSLNLGDFDVAAVTGGPLNFQETLPDGSGGTYTTYYEADIEPHLGMVNSGTNELYFGEVRQQNRACLWGSSKGLNVPYRYSGFWAVFGDPGSNQPPGYARSGDSVQYSGSGTYGSLDSAAMHGTSEPIPINDDSEHNGVTSIPGTHPAFGSSGAPGVVLSNDPFVRWYMTSFGCYSQFLLSIDGNTFRATLRVTGATGGRIYAIHDGTGHYRPSSPSTRTYAALEDIPAHPVNSGEVTYSGVIDCNNVSPVVMTRGVATGLFANAPATAILA